MKRFILRLLRVGVVATVLAAAAAAWAYKAWVVDDPGPQFTRDAVLAIIAQESPVYYRDGASRLGVFFDQEHRSYVPYAEIPDDWKHAIVSAEDGNFFHHPGVDPKHIVRAMWQNLKAGQVVAGGSTLTQQTAKNLFYRPDRTLRSKGVEFANALRLEAHFSKEDILEFYANQFHVSANGRGLGIAARYFFDKAPRELGLKECAFIAGMVKAPSRYNPFIGESEERRTEARKLAEDRTSYVLRRMVEMGYLQEGTEQEIAAKPLNFRRGSFQYDRSVVLDEVQRELEEPAFIQLFERAGIDNPSTAGIQIITTVDANVQREATWALWHHLTEIAPIMERSGVSALRLPERTAMVMEPGVALVRHAFYVGKVVTGGDTVTLDLGGRNCIVDAAGVERIATALTRARSGAGSAKADDAARAALHDELVAGNLVLASVRTMPATCDLEIRPRLQGAVVALEDGQVRAMVGGNDNRNFNRVTEAERQFGSTWKPLLYFASLQLGWLPTDLLDNRRNVFPFRDVWYYPHPDHPSDPFISMSLTGARSENLASVWLLYHLTDRLNAEQLRRLAELVDLSRRADETAQQWMERLRDVEGLRSSPERFEEYAFSLAREDVLGGIAFSAQPQDASAVRSMLYGRGTAAERARVMRTAPSAERAARLLALGNNMLSLEELSARCATDATLLFGTPDPTVADASTEVACGRAPAGWIPYVGPPPTDTLVDGRIHASTLHDLRTAIDRRAAEMTGRDAWDPDLLALNPDYRALVGVRYVTRLAAALGVSAELPSVLALPLGAADATLLEMATAYSGFLAGQRWSFPGQGYEEGSVIGMRHAFDVPAVQDHVALIAEIRDANGNVLYRLKPQASVVADAASGELVGDILRNVVKHGTGRRALGAVEVGGVAAPLAGKTGTTNDYRNAAFIGFAPRASTTPLRWGSAWTVAAYVGYDDNSSMRRGSFRVQGANGALPVWLETVRGIANAGLLGRAEEPEYSPSEGMTRVEVDGTTGIAGAGATTLTLAGSPPARRFAPFTEAPSAAAGPSDAPPAQDPLDAPGAELGSADLEEGTDPAPQEMAGPPAEGAPADPGNADPNAPPASPSGSVWDHL